MSFLAKLSLGSTEYNVLTADYEISMPVDANSRPNGSATAGTLNLTLESNNKNDLVEWASNRQKKNGQITFYRRDSQSSLKTVAFSDGYCISMREQFDASSADPMRVTVRISAGEIKINNAATLKRPWSTAAAVTKEASSAAGIDASSIMSEQPAAGGDSMSNAGDMGSLGSAASSAGSSVSSAAQGAGGMQQEMAQHYEEAKTTADAASQTANAAKQSAGQAQQGAGSAAHAPEAAEEKISSFIP